MSVKLYNGLRLIDPKTDLFELTPRIAEVVKPVFEEAARRLVAEELFRFVDNHGDFDAENPRWPILLDLDKQWKERQQSYGQHHTLNDPLRFSLVFGRSSAGNLLAYSYYSEPGYGAALDSLGVFEDYHYQDQSDGPAELTRKEWKARGQEWESLENAEGTFGDLPGWTLGRTDEPFDAVYWSRSGEEFDPNRYTTVDGRLSEILTNRLFRHASEELRITQDALIPLYSRTRSTVVRYLRSAERSSGLLAPEPLPVGTGTTYGDLPEPYRIDVNVFIDLFERLKRDIDGD